MRDPKRIDRFCARFAAMWKKVPDWRFGQLISNLLGEYVSRTHRDIFFPEDEELITAMEQILDEISSPYMTPEQEVPPHEDH